MTKTQNINVLAVNSGSSSLKYALYDIGRDEKLILSGAINGISSRTGRFYINDGNNNVLINESLRISNHEIAVVKLLRWLKKHDHLNNLDAVGHRVVHGGPRYFQPLPVSSDLMEKLHDLISISPDHLPQELKVIKTIDQYHPDIKQVVCFDTAFHRNMPELAQLYALPRTLKDEGLIRYGFHGLSYEYVLEELKKRIGNDAANGRIVVAHLGSGASMAAINRGKGVETTMGFTPTGGLMMSTRSGDLDPGVILYLLRQKNLSLVEVTEMVNKNAGLLGVSKISGDMKELLEMKKNPDAVEAVNMFCYQAKKFLGSLIAVLGGLDSLVFTGGIGENSPPIRKRICDNMEFFGIHLNNEHNKKNAAVISDVNSTVTVGIIKTNEQIMIARHTRDCLYEK